MTLRFNFENGLRKSFADVYLIRPVGSHNRSHPIQINAATKLAVLTGTHAEAGDWLMRFLVDNASGDFPFLRVTHTALGTAQRKVFESFVYNAGTGKRSLHGFPFLE